MFYSAVSEDSGSSGLADSVVSVELSDSVAGVGLKKDDDSESYTLELTVYPLDTLETTYDQVVKYIENFNSRVDEGD